ncbi:MAG: DUF1015 domain-containing protein [Ignavibacteriales bacterium]|nr:DUF1015 domain-containing protein [Ignavibacteriales bacterium]
MPELIPFKGYRYHAEKVKIQEVVAPPYDVISPDLQTRLYDKSPYNVVRLILGREDDRYRSAAEHFRTWQEQMVLVRDPEPSLYVLHQAFNGMNGESVTRKGFIALCRLEEFGKQMVLPHEKTLSKPREDRFKLFKATSSNFSQILSLYSDPEKEIDRSVNGVSKGEPVVDVVYDDVQNRLWRITDTGLIETIRKAMSDKQVVIADGHHRYETALAYRDFRRSQNPSHRGNELYNYVMMFFTNVDDENLLIYPTHRLVHSLSSIDEKEFLAQTDNYFIRREFKEWQSMMAALSSSSSPSFGLLMAGEPMVYLLSLKPSLSARKLITETLPDEVKELDVTILHSVILKGILGISWESQEQKQNLEYVREVNGALEALHNGSAQLAFLMNATKIQQVRAVAKAGYTMPQKSTFFYPKLLSGLVINKIDDSTPFPERESIPVRR